MSAPTLLPVSEVFGPTVQGEGPYTGRRVGFVRLGLCNLACEWCDTPYTWDESRYDVAAECPDTPVEEIAERLHRYGLESGVVVLSGGEPLMHGRKLRALTDLLPGVEWHAETNGTILPPPWWGDVVAHTSVSPKVITADPLKKRLKPAALAAWAEHARAGRACFKFVAQTVEDVAAIAELAHDYDVPGDAVWVMPEGTATEELLARHADLVDSILEHGFNMSTRLHVLVWGDRRGV